MIAGLALSPTGAGELDGFRGGDTQLSRHHRHTAGGRGRVGAFVFRSPERTAIGVGFGRNFIEESGSRNVLEGDTYTNVRSPHNYVIGTLARLGVFGALLVFTVIILGWRQRC